MIESFDIQLIGGLIVAVNIPLYIMLFKNSTKVGELCSRFDMLPCSPKAYRYNPGKGNGSFSNCSLSQHTSKSKL